MSAAQDWIPGPRSLARMWGFGGDADRAYREALDWASSNVSGWPGWRVLPYFQSWVVCLTTGQPEVYVCPR